MPAMTGTSRRVAIIGAGFIGTISAIEALRKGFEVTIIEPGEPGGEQASSYGNSGWLSSHSILPPSSPGLWKQLPSLLMNPLGPLAVRWGYAITAAPWLMRYLLSGSTWDKVERTAGALRPLLRDASQLHQQLADEAGVGELIHQEGLLHIYPSRAAFEAETRAWAIRRQNGITWSELDAEALRAREPDIDRRYTFGVLVEEASRCANPGRYAAALAARAEALGAQRVKASARGFRIEAERLRAIETTAGPIECDAAVISAGARSKALAAAAGDRVPLDAERGYHVSVAIDGAGARGSFMASDAKTVVTRMDFGMRAAGQVEIAGFEAAPNWERAKILERNLCNIFPGLDLSKTEPKYWMGHRPGMVDGMPCLGYSRASKDVVHAFGHGHIGLVSSARTGRLVAQLLAGSGTEIPIDAFSPRRF